MITDGDRATTLSASIVAFNSDLARLEQTLVCLAAAVRSAREAGELNEAAVVVQDNASSADYRCELGALVERLEPAFDEALELRLGTRNVGYGAGANSALQDSAAAWVLVLNPDIELAPDALAVALREVADRPEVVAVSPAARDGSGAPESLCKRYPTVLDLLLRGLGGPFKRRFAARLARYQYRDLSDREPGEVQLISGACMLIRGTAFHRVRGFDPKFFMYFEDFDLSLRLAGQGALLHLPRMQAVHHGGQAARKGWRHVAWFIASAWRFFSRHGWRWR